MCIALAWGTTDNNGVINPCRFLNGIPMLAADHLTNHASHFLNNHFAPRLVADIGGTNARLAIATLDSNQQLQFCHQQQWPSADFSDFSQLLRHYLDYCTSAGFTESVQHAVVAIAGPVTGDQVQVTNLPWCFSQRQVQQQLNFRHFVVLNDFAALAYAVPSLATQQLHRVKSGHANPTGHFAVIGPGTGLGVAGLIRHSENWLALPSEGGHITLAATNAQEAAIIDYCRAHGLRPTAEQLLSGSGLPNLYRAIAYIHTGETGLSASAAQIGQQALDGEPLARATILQFCDWLGSFCGDIALLYNASQGVRLGGGILPKVLPLLEQSQFTARFCAKAPMSALLEMVPVDLMLDTDLALMGCATLTLER